MKLLKVGDVELRERERCPIDNIFHEAEGGCYLLCNEDGTRSHVYTNIQAYIAPDFDMLPKVLGYDKKYSMEVYDKLQGFRSSTSVTRDFQGIEKLADDQKTFSSFLRNLFKNYHTYIRPLLVDDSGKQYEACVQELYDLARIDNVYMPLRPFNLAPSFKAYILDQRLAFFEILKLYDTRQRKLEESGKAEGELNKRAIRDARTCSASSFTTTRSTPPELKCQYKSASSCEHISSHCDFEGKTILSTPPRLCEFLLDQMIEDHGEHQVNHALGFKCKFVTSDPKTKLPQRFVDLFGRNTRMHRLCLPDDHLGSDWYKWLLEKIINVPGVNI